MEKYVKNDSFISNNVQMFNVQGSHLANISKLTQKDINSFYGYACYKNMKDNDFKAKVKYNAILQI